MGGTQQNSSRTTHVSIRIDSDILARLEKLAASQPIPVKRNAAINAAVRDYVERAEKKGGKR